MTGRLFAFVAVAIAIAIALMLMRPTSAGACNFPISGALIPGSYSLESSLANQIHLGMPGPAPEPSALTGTVEVSRPTRVAVVAVVPPAVWKARYRSMILATNVNNAPLSPAQRMSTIGNGTFLQIRDTGGHLWWVDSMQIATPNGRLWFNNGHPYCT